MKIGFIILFISLFITCYSAYSQDIIAVDKWKEYVEDLSDESLDEARLETLYADLSYLSEHPMDLNEATHEQLGRLPFLSDRQIGQILRYRKRVERLVSLYELKGVPELDFQTIQLVLPFVYVGEKSVDKIPLTVKNLLKYGSNELLFRYDQCFQQKKGYGSYPDSVLQEYPNRKYLGEPFYASIRYSYNFEDYLQAGFVAEKDPGEPFLSEKHKGFDYYSFHLLLKEQGVLKTLAIGDYKASFGQGLVMSNDFSPSRSALVSQAERRNNGFRRHYSTNEQDFFRGVATTLTWKDWDASLFYSYRKLDGAVENDTFPTIKTDGVHRLPRDWEKRRRVKMQTLGGNIRFAKPNFHIGLTALHYSFGGLTIYPQDRPYNRFAFKGKSNFNMGVDYMLKSRWGKFYGETAISKNGAMATLNALRLTPVSYLSLLALYRYYDRRYQAFFGNAFAQNSSVQNEQGIYLGFQWTPFGYWKISAYADFYRFPWLKYQVDYPSTGREYMAQLDYAWNASFSTYLRYKCKEKDEDGKQHRLRWQASYVLASAWHLRTSADGILSDYGGDKQKGCSVSQSIGWKPSAVPIQFDTHVAWFSTDGYASRISSYEKNILYAFYMPSFYGKGIRLAFTFRWDINRHLSLSAKLGHTYYADRDKIGTDTEEIDGNQKTDLSALLRWKF